MARRSIFAVQPSALSRRSGHSAPATDSYDFDTPMPLVRDRGLSQGGALKSSLGGFGAQASDWSVPLGGGSKRVDLGRLHGLLDLLRELLETHETRLALLLVQDWIHSPLSDSELVLPRQDVVSSINQFVNKHSSQGSPGLAKLAQNVGNSGAMSAPLGARNPLIIQENSPVPMPPPLPASSVVPPPRVGTSEETSAVIALSSLRTENMDSPDEHRRAQNCQGTPGSSIALTSVAVADTEREHVDAGREEPFSPQASSKTGITSIAMTTGDHNRPSASIGPLSPRSSESSAESDANATEDASSASAAGGGGGGGGDAGTAEAVTAAAAAAPTATATPSGPDPNSNGKPGQTANVGKSREVGLPTTSFSAPPTSTPATNPGPAAAERPRSMSVRARGRMMRKESVSATIWTLIGGGNAKVAPNDTRKTRSTTRSANDSDDSRSESPSIRATMRSKFTYQRSESMDVSADQYLSVPTHPLILAPHGVFRMAWDIMALVLILEEAVVVPITIGFDLDSPGWMNWVSSFVFLFDICLNFITGYFKDGFQVMRQVPIIKNYARTWLLLDICSTFPWFLIFEGSENASTLRFTKVGKFMRMIKLLRIMKLSALVGAVEDYLNSSAAVIGIKLTKVIAVIFLITHWIACFWGWLGHPDRYDSENTVELDPDACEPGGPCEPGVIGSPWLRRYALERASTQNQYLIALRFAAGLFTGSDFGIQPGFFGERIFVVFTMFASFILLSMTLSKIVVLFNQIGQENVDHGEMMLQFKDFMNKGGVPFSLQQKVRRYLEFQYKSRKELQTRRFEMLDKLSPWLRKEVTVHLNRPVLTLHPFFREMPAELLPHACVIASSVLCAPGDVVLQTGQTQQSMYFLVRGKLQVLPGKRVLTESGAVRMPTAIILDAPNFICAEALFRPQWAAPYTVVCISHCELLRLPKNAFDRLQLEFPDLQAYLEKQQGDESMATDCMTPIFPV